MPAAARDINAQNGKTQKITLSQCEFRFVGWLVACLPACLLSCLVVLVIRFGSVKFGLVLVAINLFHFVREHNIDIHSRTMIICATHIFITTRQY